MRLLLPMAILSLGVALAAESDITYAPAPRSIAVPVMRISPNYPASALRRNVDGNAIVVAYVDDRGQITALSC